MTPRFALLMLLPAIACTPKYNGPIRLDSEAPMITPEPTPYPDAKTYTEWVGKLARGKWKPSADAKEHTMGCTIHLKIGADGKILWSEVETRSGSQPFDDSAAAAVFKLEHVPPPPPALRATLARDGITIRFDSRVRIIEEPPL